MSTSYLDRGPGRIAYDVTGSGPLVVCLPGMGDLRSVYRFLTPVLVEAGYRVATMDLRGHGDSDGGFDSYDSVAAATDALALIEHLGGENGRALLIGNSMTGGSAVWAAAEAPDRITGLVLIDPFVRDTASPLAAFAFRALLLRPWGPAAWRSYHRRLFPARRPADFAEEERRMMASLRRKWSEFARTARTTHAPAAERLSSVKAPAMVVMGTKDIDWPDPVAEARFVAQAVHGEVLLVPDAGHYPMAEFPELVGPAVVGFADRVHARA